MKAASTFAELWTKSSLRPTIEGKIQEIFQKIEQQQKDPDSDGDFCVKQKPQKQIDTCVVFLSNEARSQYNSHFLSEMLDLTAAFECELRDKKKGKTYKKHVFLVFISAQELQNDEKTRFWLRNFIFAEGILPIYFETTLVNVITLNPEIIYLEP